MKKFLHVLFVFVFVLGSVLVLPNKTARANSNVDPGLAPGNWKVNGIENPGAEIPVVLTTSSAPSWLLPITKAVVINGGAKICHAFRGGQFGWTGEIRQLVNGKWVLVPTVNDWVPTREGIFTSCAQVPFSGTYALFAYYKPSSVSTTPSYCDSGKWWGNYYAWYEDDTVVGYYLSIQFTEDFPEDVPITYTMISETNIDIPDTQSTTTYLYKDGLLYADFDDEAMNLPEPNVWSVTIQVSIKGCTEIITIDNNDLW
jgi:hypothetical protein